MVEHDRLQRIERLTPLRKVLSHITASVVPVAPIDVQLAAALGHVAAEDVTVTKPMPAAAVALRDGYAVRAEATADASAYSPIPLAQAYAIGVGERLPTGADAVAPLESVLANAAGVQALAATTAGDGVLVAGIDVRPGQPVQVTGTQLRQVDLAVLAVAGVSRIKVRAPRVRVVAARADAIIRHIVTLTEGLVSMAGGDTLPAVDAGFEAALARDDAQVMVVIGGSGTGIHDRSIAALARVGRVDVHGMGITPGETAALGAVGEKPVLILPGRIDAALAAWLTVGVPLMRHVTACTEQRPATFARLERKLTSTVGLLEFVPVRVHHEKATPLASGYLPLHALSQANGYILVPAESEGFPEGATVAVRSMP